MVNFKVVNTCKFWRDAIIYVLLEFGACLPIKWSVYYHWLENIAIKTGQTCEFTVDLSISVGNKIVRFKNVWLKNRILRSKNLVFWYSDCKAWLLSLKTLAYFQSKIEFTSKYLVFRSKYQVSQKYVTNGFRNLWSKVWRGIIYQYILNLHDTLEHGRVLGRSNLKNR